MTAVAIDADQFLEPIWRLNNLYTIIDKDGKAIPFRPNWAQQVLLGRFHSRNLILKARQLGFTTLMCLVQLDDCIFTPNTRAALIAHRLEDAKRIFRDKVKFPYDALDDALRSAVPATQDSADTLTFGNNSSFAVSTSARSGTLNWLHVSEYGKICAQFPEKAREIRTGSFPAAENGVITIESTAEGEEGDFYERCRQAQELEAAEAELTKRDPRFFFFPWWREPRYVQRRSTAPCSPDDVRYFERIESETGTVLTEEQRNWWLAQERELGGDMKREYPATPGEAFEQALEGAILADDLAIATKHRRIGDFPLDPSRPVNTFWDIGMSVGNETAIWLEQDHGEAATFIGYYENSGEWLEHYLTWLKAWATEYRMTFGKHYLPHDSDRQNFFLPEGTYTVMARMGFRPDIVERTPDKAQAIQMGKRAMAQARFDAAGCKEGLGRLKRYRKEWDEKRGVWKPNPHHGPESNGADAFLTFAQSGHRPLPPIMRKIDRYRDHGEPEEGSWMSA